MAGNAVVNLQGRQCALPSCVGAGFIPPGEARCAVNLAGGQCPPLHDALHFPAFSPQNSFLGVSYMPLLSRAESQFLRRHLAAARQVTLRRADKSEAKRA